MALYVVYEEQRLGFAPKKEFDSHETASQYVLNQMNGSDVEMQVVAFNSKKEMKTMGADSILGPESLRETVRKNIDLYPSQLQGMLKKALEQDNASAISPAEKNRDTSIPIRRVIQI